MRTDDMNETDVQAPAEPSSWYVALAQLPGLPVKLQLAVLAGVAATVQQMPVSSCRNHRWAGAPRAPAKASEVGDGSALLAGDFPDLAEPEDQVQDAAIEAEKLDSDFLAGEFLDGAEPENQVPDASIEAEKMESAFLADCMIDSRLTGEART